MVALLLAAAATALQGQQDILGIHNMGPGTPGPVSGSLPECQFCHAPHSGVSIGIPVPLWSQKLSTENNYTLYSNPQMVNQVLEPTLGSASNLCLSCHDGTVAPGTTVPYGSIKMSGSMSSQDLFAGTLQGMHPFNFKLPLQSAPNLLPSLTSSGTTGNPAVKLINGNVQCNTCHDPHVQNNDPVAGDFLVMNNANSALCLACHVSQPEQISASQARTAASGTTGTSDFRRIAGNNQYNAFTVWRQSVHATITNRLGKNAKGIGAYPSVNLNACGSCHVTHKAPGTQELLSGPVPAILNMDTTTQNCITCHNGGTNISPAIPNVFAEFAKTGHPFPAGSNQHTAKENLVLNNNRHATCVDCHDPHASRQTNTFVSTEIRPSQAGTIGVSAADGTTAVNPAMYQYETCLRCHGTSLGKQTLTIFGYAPVRSTSGGDPLNLLPQFGVTARSSHPVMQESKGGLPQPSLLKFMWNLDGRTQGKPITARILCTDCHNSDDNREFGGSGPNGPHGSQYAHILERRYEYSQVAPGPPPLAGPGSTVTNLLPVVLDPGGGGPYSLCAKCHNLSSIVSDVSFTKHSLHIKAGFSCSVCHTPHGMGPTSSNVLGERLVNFDLKVVGENETSSRSPVASYFQSPISYNRANNTCTLRCHNYNHNADGSVTLASGGAMPATVKH